MEGYVLSNKPWMTGSQSMPSVFNYELHVIRAIESVILLRANWVVVRFLVEERTTKSEEICHCFKMRSLGILLALLVVNGVFHAGRASGKWAVLARWRVRTETRLRARWCCNSRSPVSSARMQICRVGKLINLNSQLVTQRTTLGRKGTRNDAWLKLGVVCLKNAAMFLK